MTSTGAKTAETAASTTETSKVAAIRAELTQVQLKLKGIEEISRALGSEHNIDRILDTVMERTTELMDAERATLFVVDDDTNMLWSRNTQGGTVATIEVPIGHGIAGWVGANGRTVNVKD
ncbi:MAG: GAF domain-containing protein, partial [Myxococcota bacterium]|nr:GAF domain-containing protein [Myxococcota bacterium]